MSVRRKTPKTSKTTTKQLKSSLSVSSFNRSKSFSGRPPLYRIKTMENFELYETTAGIPGMNSSPLRGGDWADSPGPADGIRRQELCSRVMLTITAKIKEIYRELRDLDPDECIDPYCRVSVCDSSSAPNRQWEFLGQTEVIGNTDTPEWSTKICLTYFFEEQQRLHFEVFDKNKEGLNPAGRLYPKRIGQCSMLLHELVSANMNRLSKNLMEEGEFTGTLTVVAEELSEGRQESVYFVVSGHNLDRKDFLGKCDPFLKICRINLDNTLQLAFRTRYHEQNLNPKWKPFEILTQQLCYGDKDRPFLIECFDWDQDGNHDLVGACQTTVNRLLCGLDKELPVDFTKSNLPMQDHSSLHRRDRMNQYELAIGAILEICQHYSRSKLFNAYGFGARIPSVDDKVHYNFPLNLETNDPRCKGVDGVLEAYSIAQSKVELSGPTDFTPTIRLAARRAASLPENGCKYCVLLIITDGAITDFEQTKEEIIKASSLPLSIIVVGVGYDTFDEMKVLDSDNRLLCSHKKYAKRDIVQFVQIRKFLPPHRTMTELELAQAKAKLAKEVLFEVPGQLIGYMKSKGISPRDPDDPFTEIDRQILISPAAHRLRDASLGSGVSARRSSSLKTNKEILAGIQPRPRKSVTAQYSGSPRAHRRLLPTPPAQDDNYSNESNGDDGGLNDKMQRAHFF
uniref:C2 domain-containing protein n=1 Tax=Meloidogyne hapla TaxID=6305 RepID=A0A1I8B0W0_MELHA